VSTSCFALSQVFCWLQNHQITSRTTNQGNQSTSWEISVLMALLQKKPSRYHFCKKSNLHAAWNLGNASSRLQKHCSNNDTSECHPLITGAILWTDGNKKLLQLLYTTTTTTPQPFYGPFTGTTRVRRCQKRNFWLTEADTPTIRLGATPSGLTSAHLHHPPFYRPDALPAAQATVSNNEGN